MAQTNKKPNIMLIMADQWNHLIGGFIGNSQVITPNLDKLAKEGTVFENCYCNSPLCAPSRASMLTGQLVRKNNVYDNGAALSSEMPTLIHHLRNSGYETHLSGKIHYIGPDQLHGFEKRHTTNIYPASFDWVPNWDKGLYMNYGTSIDRCLVTDPVCTWNMQMSYDEEVLHTSLEAIRTWGSQEKPERPFFLMSSFSNPHEPYSVPKEYWDLYEGVEIDLPSKNSITHDFDQWLMIHHGLDQHKLTDDQIRSFRRAYYAMITYFDKNVGLLIKELEHMGLKDSTAIFITSDHGDMLGEKGMWFKRHLLEPSIHVPFIAHWPENFPAGETRKEVVSLADLCPTIMNLAETLDFEFWTKTLYGDSFLDVIMEEGNECWKNSAICEYFSEGVSHIALTIIKDNWKYIHVNQNDSLLYDLDSDPDELCNLINDSTYTSLVKELKEELCGTLDLDLIEEQVHQSQQNRLLIRNALREGEPTIWDYPVRNDPSKKYVRYDIDGCDYHG